MVSEAYTLLLSRPVYAMAPGICIMLLVLVLIFWVMESGMQ